MTDSQTAQIKFQTITITFYKKLQESKNEVIQEYLKKGKNRINKWLQLMLEETPHQTKLSKLF